MPLREATRSRRERKFHRRLRKELEGMLPENTTVYIGTHIRGGRVYFSVGLPRKMESASIDVPTVGIDYREVALKALALL